jgi:hypothetical protein
MLTHYWLIDYNLPNLDMLIGIWRRGDGGGTVKKESKKEVETVANLDMLIGIWCRGDGGGTVKKESKKSSKQLRITIRGKTRCILLHFDSSKRCVCPLYKFL